MSTEGPATDTLALADGGDAADLTTFLDRLLRLDARAVVRLRTRGDRLAVFAAPPFDVLVVRVLRLARPADVDAVVRADELTEVVRASAVPPVPPVPSLPLPLLPLPPRRDAAWTTTLPPLSGWEPYGTVSGARALAAAQGADRRVREAMADAPGLGRTAVVESLAARVWAETVATDDGQDSVPVRLLHAANAFGFLGAGAAAGAGAAVGCRLGRTPLWLRLEAAYGTVVARRTTPLAVFA